MAKKLVKGILEWAGWQLAREDKAVRRYRSLYRKYKNHTMVPEESFISNLDLCNHFKHLPGDYVECGVWRGGMSAAIGELLNGSTNIHLFDSFEGLPPARDIDGTEAIAWQRDTSSPSYFNNCQADETEALQAMKMAGLERFRIHKGWFEQTLPRFGNSAVAILRLDGDWYDSISVCLEHLFPNVVEGGIVLLDDYYTWDGCARATHDYLSRVQSPSRIFQWHNQVAFILKKS